MRRRGMLVAVVAMALTFAVPAGAGADDSAAGWYRVQFGGIVSGADRATLDAAGARSPLYVPHNAYVAWVADEATRDAIREVPAVASVRRVPVSEKVAGSARSTRRLTALVYGGDVIGARRALDAVSDATVVTGARGAALREVLVRGADAGRVAAVAQVLHVSRAPGALKPEDEGTAQIQAGGINAARTAPVPGYPAWLSARDVTGTGEVVAVVDTGVDEKHPDLAGRVTKHRDYTPVPEPEDSFGHGTHVAGIVGGAGTALGGLRDDAGFLYGLGVAPGVRLLDINAIGTTTVDWPPPYGFARLTADALTAGAAVWNASWHTGEGTGAGYLPTAREMDELVRDGDPSRPAAQPFTMVFSAGNAGPKVSTMTAPKEAKNIISVASTASQRVGVHGIDEVSSFSSRGPARDGRILPTVAAPGEGVVSARSLPAGAVCNEPPADGSSAGLYGVCSGTSMAAPHVAGAVALVREHWRRRTGGAPSPALVKALLVNSATDMGRPDVPNGEEGWGRVNLGGLLDPSVERTTVDQSDVMDEPGDVRRFRVKPADPHKPLRVTLAWTDAPGTPQANKASPALVNDLDLVVKGPSTEWLGNSFSGGRSVQGGTADRLNNLESVHLQDTGKATHVVEVRAHNLPGDGVPGAGDTTDQDFALVVSNGVAEAVPPAPVLGAPYAHWDFDTDADGWTTTGVPTWSRSAPGTKTGASDPSTGAFAFEGRTTYMNNADASLLAPEVETDPGLAVLDFWLRVDTEAGWDFVKAEWSSDGEHWRLLHRFSDESAGYATGAWVRQTLGFTSPGGPVRVRLRFTSDSTASALTHSRFTGARVDEVTLGKQAGAETEGR